MTLLLPHNPDLREGICVATTWSTMIHCMLVFYMISIPQPTLFIEYHNNPPFTQKKCFAFEIQSGKPNELTFLSSKCFSPLRMLINLNPEIDSSLYSSHFKNIAQHRILPFKENQLFLHYLCQSQHKYLNNSDYHV